MLDKGTSKSTVVESNRIIYTPSNFAKNTLFHIQEIGNLQAKKPHISRHTNLITLFSSPRHYLSLFLSLIINFKGVPLKPKDSLI